MTTETIIISEAVATRVAQLPNAEERREKALDLDASREEHLRLAEAAEAEGGLMNAVKSKIHKERARRILRTELTTIGLTPTEARAAMVVDASPQRRRVVGPAATGRVAAGVR